MPPSNLKISFFPLRSSVISISKPAFKNASSFNRFAMVSYLISVVSKISESGKNVIVVPLVSVVPISFKGSSAAP